MSLRGGAVAEYCAAGPAAWKTPGAVLKVSNQDLRGYAGGADFIIVTSQEFRDGCRPAEGVSREAGGAAVSRRLSWTSARSTTSSAAVLPDITAIRDYLKYAYDTWTQRPTFVLFFGGASYDYKGILGTKSSFGPDLAEPGIAERRAQLRHR